MQSSFKQNKNDTWAPDFMHFTDQINQSQGFITLHVCENNAKQKPTRKVVQCPELLYVIEAWWAFYEKHTHDGWKLKKKKRMKRNC